MSPHRFTDVPVAGDRRNLRRGYMIANGFELMLAVAAILGAVAFLLDPASFRDSSLASSVGVYIYGWEALYLAGGVLVVVGLSFPSWRIEIAGLSLLSSAIAINGAAIVIVHHLSGVPVALFYAGWCAAAAARAWLVLRMARIGGRSNR